MSKNVGSAPSLDDFNDAMTSRYTSHDEPEGPPQPRKESTSTAGRDEKPAMTRRSWLLPTEVGAEFAEAANRIHHGSGGRISKSEAQAALIRAGLQHEAEIAQQLDATSANDRT